MRAYRINRLQVGEAVTADATALDEDRIGGIDFTEPYDVGFDAPVTFWVGYPLAGLTDAPVATGSVQMLSRRVVQALRALGDVDALEYPVQLVDLSGQAVGGPDDFVIFHVQTVLDVVDRDSSGVDVIDRPGSALHGTLRVRRLELVSVPTGFPTCFLVEHAGRFGILVNEHGRDALEALGPLGFELVEVPVRAPLA